MAHIRDYLNKMCTQQLLALLRRDAMGMEALPGTVVLLICGILSERLGQ